MIPIKQTRIAAFLAGALAAAPLSAAADITFAVVGAMSGPFTKIGTEFKQGARGAVESINADGGVLGQKLAYIVRDDECNAAKASKVAEEIVAMKIPFVVGHLCSEASIAASDIYEAAGVVQISPSSTNPNYTERGLKYAFRTTGRDDMQGFVIAEHILRNFKTKRLGIAYQDKEYSRGVAEVTKRFLNQGGIEELFFMKLPSEPDDFSAVFDEIKKMNVNVLLFPGHPGAVMKLASQIKQKGVTIRVIGADAFSGITFTDENRRNFDGYQFSFPPDPADDRRNRAITKRYKSQGYKPQAFTYYTYGAVQAWAQAARKAGTVNAAEVAQALRSRKFKTVLGEISFDAKGDISNPGFVMYFFNKGKRYYLD